MIDIRKVFRSFRFAFRGILDLFLYENNAKVHLTAAVAVVALGIWLDLSALEWAVVLSQIGLVWMAEAFNSALEKLADVVSTEHHPGIRAAKDMAAGGVLLVVIMAVVVGLIIFGGRLYNLFL